MEERSEHRRTWTRLILTVAALSVFPLSIVVLHVVPIGPGESVGAEISARLEIEDGRPPCLTRARAVIDNPGATALEIEQVIVLVTEDGTPLLTRIDERTLIAERSGRPAVVRPRASLNVGPLCLDIDASRPRREAALTVRVAHPDGRVVSLQGQPIYRGGAAVSAERPERPRFPPPADPDAP
jgi:hypothetical protein